MTIEITGRASGHDDYTNVSVARESLQRFGEHVAHLSVEIDALWAAQCNDRNSVGHFCRQNIGVHRVLLTWNALFFLYHFYTDIFRSKQFAVAVLAQNCWFSHQLTTSNGYTPLQSCSNPIYAREKYCLRPKTKPLNGMPSAPYTASASGAALSAKISTATLE